MNRTQLIDRSLNKCKLEKLIVFLGYTSESTLECRRAAATRVRTHLLNECGPSPADVHDPHTNRFHSRDASGRARRYYDSQTVAMGAKGRRQQRRGVVPRSPQTWDSEKVQDFMGLWCDRLLLGDHTQPFRTAVLEPQVPVTLQGEALACVARSHRHLSPADVLVVSAHPDLPFGLIRQQNGLVVAADTCVEPSVPGTTPLPESIQVFGQGSCTSLLLGVGDDVGLCGAFTAAEELRLRTCLVPLCAFASALWTTNSSRSASYVEHMTPTAEHLTPQNANQRLWKTLQGSMLSTRDAAVLRAYYTDAPLDARMSEGQTQYLAETLLSRLGDGSRD